MELSRVGPFYVVYSCAEDNLNGTLSNAVGHIAVENM